MSLLTTLQVKQVAWRWAGTTRVYEATNITVAGEDDVESFITANLKKSEQHNGVWLFFEVFSEHFRRISPSATSGNDYIDILNALKNPAVTVQFYPIWSVDDSINYEVKKIAGRQPLFATNRTLFKPSASIQMEAVDIVADWPAWARTTRLKG